MATLTKHKIEPRVSEETFGRMRILTGQAFSGIKNAVVQLISDGKTYEVTFDEHGNAGPAKEIIGHDLR